MCTQGLECPRASRRPLELSATDPLLLMRLSCSAPLGKGVPAPTGTSLALFHSLKRNTPHPPEIIRASED